MSIAVFGINHRSAPLGVIERVALNDERLVKALDGLTSRDTVRESVILSTCNRTEVYVVAEKFHGAFADVREMLQEVSGLTADELTPHLFSQHDDHAVSHLFDVVSGLDSAVLGEAEIVGQVKTAWDTARRVEAARTTLNLLFRHALEVGKRARTETAISRGTASVSHAAVEMATDLLGTLAGKNVVVIGAGEMGTGIARALSADAAASVVVLNRSKERATELADSVGATVRDFTELNDALSNADVLLTSTGSGEVVVTAEVLSSARGSAGDRPLLVVDIAVPRDVEHAAGDLPGVTLRDLHDLRDWAQQGVDARAQETNEVRSIIVQEVARFGEVMVERQAAPLIAELHERAEQIRQAEVERYVAQLGGLTKQDREAVESLTKSIVAKLLHSPSMQLKKSAGTPQGERISAALRDLFDIE